MPTTLRSIVRRLLFIAGALLILVAIAIGGFRILATRIPAYQSELTAWVRDELSLELRFDRVDLRWGLSGPELTFFDATVATEDPLEPFLVARQAMVALDPVALVTSRSFSANRLVLEGIRFTIVRTEDGRFSIDGAGTEAAAPAFDFELPAEVELIVRDSEVVYEDRVENLVWPFDNVTVTAKRGPDSLTMGVLAAPPAELGRHLELSVDGNIPPGATTSRDFRAFASVRGADLAALSRFSPWDNAAGFGGTADLSLWLGIAAGRLVEVTLDVAAENLLVSREAPASVAVYDELGFTAQWTGDAGGWRVALGDTRVRRGGREWPSNGTTVVDWRGGLERASRISFSSDFLRLSDLTPFVERLPLSELRQQWLALRPRGDLRGVTLDVGAGDAAYDYRIEAELRGLAFSSFGRLPGIAGLDGRISADARDGRMSFDGADVEIDLPGILPRVVEADALDGVLVWRQGRDALRLVSDDLAFEVLGAPVETSLELTIPHDGSSAHLDLVSRTGAFDVSEFMPFLPFDRLPRGAADWLERAVLGGRVEEVDVGFFGVLDDFPFDRADGQFRVAARVTDGLVDYIERWPAAADLEGTIEFAGAGFRAEGSGRVLGNVSEDVAVEIPDLRDPVLGLQMTTAGPLTDVFEFLRTAPLIAEYLGPDYSRLEALAGSGRVRLDLGVPLRQRERYTLSAGLDVTEGEIAVSGFPARFAGIDGRLDLADGVVTGEGIEAVFLDGPVVASVRVPEEPGYRSVLEIEGEVTADSVLRSFGLPYRELFAGQTHWQGRLSLPSHTSEPELPVRIGVSSNLSGVAMRLPEPFTKPPATATNMRIDFAFGRDGTLTVAGNLGATRRFSAEYVQDGERFGFRRGHVRFGGDVPALAEAAGLVVDGSLPVLDLGEWLDLMRERDVQPSYPLLTGLDLRVNDLSAFGQHLGTTAVQIARRDDAWEIDVDSEAIAGRIFVPVDLSARPTVSAAMSRVYLQAGRSTGLGAIDPRRLPGIEITAEAFGFGTRQLGRFEARVSPDALGVRLDSFTSESGSFSASGSGAWFNGGAGAQTRLAFSLRSNDVAATLTELGFDPLLEGELAEVTASVRWPGGPAREWTEHVGGDIGIRVEDGTILDIDPGAGRLVGLMSIMALPRRLALDFRDVFNRGFAFDEIGGDFLIVDGNAFTDNLKLSGPAAEIGVVGRTGLRDRDFHQQAVVTAEPSKMLPTVGGLIAGAGVGAALLIFTRIFKEPLSGIGRVSYCIKGSWDAPVVERLTPEQLNQEALCAELPPELSLAGEGAASP